jgi:ubiquinone/menaquinone biosynthesis C-methylase UbiE
MNFKGIDICCPHCRSELEQPGGGQLVCLGCRRRFPVVLDIPDLRIAPDPYIGFAEEGAKVQKLAAGFPHFDFEGFIDFYYSITSVVPPQHAQMYKRGLLAGVERARAWLEAWEAAAAGRARPRAGGALLEIGCGTAPLLGAASGYAPRCGVDIALRWLVVAKKRLEHAGIDLPLICACAEALPFREPIFDRVVADSALEHMKDQLKTLAEARRVLRPGGSLFVATPNRMSVGPDPQTGVWCGSWLPEKWTAAIVRRQGGIPPVRHLLSRGELARLLVAAGFTEIEIFLPQIPDGQRARFSPFLQRLVRLYEASARLPVGRQILHRIGPLLQAVARNPKMAAMAEQG